MSLERRPIFPGTFDSPSIATLHGESEMTSRSSRSPVMSIKMYPILNLNIRIVLCSLREAADICAHLVLQSFHLHYTRESEMTSSPVISLKRQSISNMKICIKSHYVSLRGSRYFCTPWTLLFSPLYTESRK